jgi:hypothetical protein
MPLPVHNPPLLPEEINVINVAISAVLFPVVDTINILFVKSNCPASPITKLPTTHAPLLLPLALIACIPSTTQLPNAIFTPSDVSVDPLATINITTLRVLWFTFTLAAVLDGFSRKLLALKVYTRVPRTRDMARLVGATAREHGAPRFVIADHGAQFRQRFGQYLALLGVTLVQGPVRAPFFNGKVERLFRTFRIWWRLVLTGLSPRALQRRLDAYRHWYNACRPHGALGGRVPEEAWNGERWPAPIPLRARDKLGVGLEVRRLKCRGDPRLPVIHIARRAA